MNILFFGTSEFAIPSLEKLIDDCHNIVAVYTQPPSQTKRSKSSYKSPVHIIAEKHDLEIRTPSTLKNNKDEEEWINSKDIDVIVVASYGHILPAYIIDYPKYGCFNIHASLLPAYRGASPIQQAILNGDRVSGITIIKMDYGLDTGDIICKSPINIEDMDYNTLHSELSYLGAEFISLTIDHGMFSGVKQEGVSSYAPKITKEDGIVDWNDEASVIYRKVLALSSNPGVTFTFNDEKIKIFKVFVNNDIILDKAPGEVSIIDKRLYVSCGNNTSIEILKVQRPSKNITDVSSYIHNNIFKDGDKFE